MEPVETLNNLKLKLEKEGEEKVKEVLKTGGTIDVSRTRLDEI